MDPASHSHAGDRTRTPAVRATSADGTPTHQLLASVAPLAAPPLVTTAGVAQPDAPPVPATPPPKHGAAVVLVAAVALALCISFLCSIFESVLLSVSRGYVESMAARGSRAGKILRHWKRTEIEVPIAAILILNTLAHTVGATVAGSNYESVFDPSTLWIFSLVFTLAVLFFTEIIPKTLGVAYARKLAGPVTLIVRVLVTVLKPVLYLTTRLSRALTADAERPVTSIEEIRVMAALGSRQGALGPRIAAFIEGVTSLHELTVHDVMVPRGSIGYLSGKQNLEANLEVVRTSGHSRFPYTPTGDLDDIDGVVLAKDLLFLDHDARGRAPDWDKLRAQLLVVPPGKHLDEVLKLFQDQRKHLAVVVDEYGGTQGVVTLEDVLEEIVGEIEDETDRVERLIIKHSDGRLVCRGWAETRKLFKVLGIDDKTEYVTVGGFVSELLGRVPAAGDVVEHGKLRFTVTKASKRRAELVEVRVIDEVPAEAGVAARGD